MVFFLLFHIFHFNLAAQKILCPRSQAVSRYNVIHGAYVAEREISTDARRRRRRRDNDYYYSKVVRRRVNKVYE